MTDSEFIYNRGATELNALINKNRLKEITSTSGNSAVVLVSNVKELFFDAIMKSSLHSYNGFPYLFTGWVYERMSIDEYKTMIHELWVRLGLPLAYYEMRRDSITRDCLSRINTKILHPDNSRVVFENGVFDLDTKRFYKEVDKSTVQLSVMPYNFDNTAICPNWHMFLDSVLPDKLYQEVLQQFLGSIFIDRHLTKLETMLLLYGDGANGKSVIFQTIVGLLGMDNVSNYGVSSLVSGQEKKKNIASINGKRLNYCSELGIHGFVRDTDTLKALISGEPMEARALYGNNFTAYDIPLFMGNTNSIPKFLDMSNGMKRSITVIPFKIQIPIEKRNANLATELASEYPGIFNWVVEGRDSFRMNGYRYKEITYVEGVTKEVPLSEGNVMLYMISKNKFKHVAYMADKSDTTEQKGTWYTLKYLYGNYISWGKKNNTVPPVSVTMFRKILTTNGYEYSRKAVGMSFKVYKNKLKIKMREYRQ